MLRLTSRKTPDEEEVRENEVGEGGEGRGVSEEGGRETGGGGNVGYFLFRFIIIIIIFNRFTGWVFLCLVFLVIHLPHWDNFLLIQRLVG